jgi:hypothetical protein
MFKPKCFSRGYVASRNMPYNTEDPSGPNLLPCGGVLRKGQPVWLKESPPRRPTKTLVPAYVEHLGVISLDARFLVDFDHSVEPRRSTTPTEKHHNHMYVSR